MSVAVRLRIPGPHTVVGLALAAAGAALVVVNRDRPDESLWLGVALAAWGLLASFTLPRPGMRRVQEIVAVTCLLLVGGELAVRHENAAAQARYTDRFLHFVADPELRYEMRPHIAMAQGRTNAHGMLDRERSEAKTLGTLRIACLGDSVGGDMQLPHDNACAALEAELSRTCGGRNVEVLNFSVPGYNALQEARALEVKALPFAPDAVVVLYVHNDPYPDLAISHHLPGHLKFQHLLFSGLAWALSPLRGIDAHPMVQMLAGLYQQPQAWQGVVVTALARIAATARSHGPLPVVVAVFPLFTEPQSPRLVAAARQVLAEAERHGLIGLDLGPALFQQQPVAALLKPSRDLIHPNALAHRLAAQAIAVALLGKNPQWCSR